MAPRPGTREGRTELEDERNSGGRSDVDTGLSVLASDAQGSKRCAAIRDNGCADAILASLRDADGGSTSSSKREDRDEAVLHDGGGLCASGERHGGNRKLREEGILQSLREIEPPQLTYVSNGYREPVEETVTPSPSERVRDGDEVLAENTSTFDDLVAKSLVKINEILDYDLPPRNHPDFQRMMSTQKDASVAIVGAGLKADENRFRRRQTNILKDLFERMERSVGNTAVIES